MGTIWAIYEDIRKTLYCISCMKKEVSLHYKKTLPDDYDTLFKDQITIIHYV